MYKHRIFIPTRIYNLVWGGLSYISAFRACVCPRVCTRQHVWDGSSANHAKSSIQILLMYAIGGFHSDLYFFIVWMYIVFYIVLIKKYIIFISFKFQQVTHILEIGYSLIVLHYIPRRMAIY